MYNFSKLVAFLHQKIEIYIPFKINEKTFALPGVILSVERKGVCLVWLTGSTTTFSVGFDKIFLNKDDCKKNVPEVNKYIVYYPLCLSILKEKR